MRHQHGRSPGDGDRAPSRAVAASGDRVVVGIEGAAMSPLGYVNPGTGEYREASLLPADDRAGIGHLAGVSS